MDKRPLFPNILLLSGTGRNVGKTSFVCGLLQHFGFSECVAVKVSPHWHEPGTAPTIAYEEGRVMLLEETRHDSPKDTSRMLRGGASVVYYLQHTDEKALMEAFELMMGKSGVLNPVIIESAILGKYIRPGVHLLIHRETDPPSTKKRANVPFDRKVTFDGQGFDLPWKDLVWENNGWRLIKQQ